jgi:hypothetical protein
MVGLSPRGNSLSGRGRKDVDVEREERKEKN